MNIEDEVKFFDSLMARYSPEVISYIDNTSADPYRIVTIILMKLEQKGKIKFEEGRLVVVDESTSNLTEAEAFVLERIRDGRVILFNYLKLKYLIFKEGKEKGLFTSIVQKVMDKKMGVFNNFLLLPISGVIMFIITECLFLYSLRKIYVLLFILSGILYAGIFPALSKYIYRLEKMTFARSLIAEDINSRIDKLKLSIVNDYETFKNWRNFDEFLFILGLNTDEINNYKRYITIYKKEDGSEKRLNS